MENSPKVLDYSGHVAHTGDMTTAYADQRAHDVSWMTAEGRSAYDRRLRQLDAVITQKGAETMTKQQQRDAAWLYWEAEADLTMTKQQLVGLVTDDTPTHLEYRDYRGYVLIDADTGEWVRDVDDEERARMELGDPIYSVEYADLRPVLS